MLSEKNIVVTIGNYGAVIALHSGNKITEHAFLDDFNDNARSQISKICLANKKASIYVLLDTIDQSYKKKIYPSVRKSDLTRIVKRDLATDGDATLLKGYIIMNQKKIKNSTSKASSSNRWECLFISSSDSDLINKWIDYLLELPNRLMGIYMSPVETFGFFQALQTNIKSQSKSKNKRNELYCVILQNQVSGIRQIVFSDQGIVFTRVVNYDFSQPDFLEKYEHDIYSTFEYLKRIFPNLTMSELEIVNIFSDKVLSSISTIHNPEINFINYTPEQAATKSGFRSLIDSNSEFCDFLISKFFSKQKKILRFTTPKILALEKFFLAIKASYYINLILLVLIFAISLATLLAQDKIAESIQSAEAVRYATNEELAKLKKLAFEGGKINDEDQVVTAERVIDFGKIDEALNVRGKNFSGYYSSLKFLKDLDVKLDSYSYSLTFNSKMPNAKQPPQISIGGKLYNKSGDIDSLFTIFDSIVGELKKNFSKAQIKYEELPRTLDFSSKYNIYPINFTIIESANYDLPESGAPQM